MPVCFTSHVSRRDPPDASAARTLRSQPRLSIELRAAMKNALAIRPEAQPGELIRAADAGAYAPESGAVVRSLGPVRRVQVRPHRGGWDLAAERVAGRYREAASLAAPPAQPIVTLQA